MITLGIIGIVAALGVPTLVRIFHKEALRQATSDFIEVAANARALAIQRGAVAELTINVEGRSVSMGGGGGGGGEASAPAATRDRSSAQWPDTVKLEGLGINFIDFTEHPQATVRFFPNGTCDELIVILSNDQGECRMITWEVTTGLASVSTDRKRFGEL
jgi:Tfp pilus assembly protein FimT